MRILVVFAIIAASSAASAEPLKTAVFDLELIDTSQGTKRVIRDDQTRRLQLVSDELRNLLQASPEIQLVDIAPKINEINQKSPLYSCNGCAEDLAQSLGADLSVSGIVRKTSELILSFAVTVKDAQSGKIIRGGQADIRGNTDESWLRGIRWIVKNRLLYEPLSARP